MTGNLDMDSNFVRNLGIDLIDHTTAVPKSYVDALLSGVIAYFITADIDMSNFKITNWKSPTVNSDASTKGYIDETLSKSHIIASSKNNVFRYLDDPNDTSSEYNITVNAFTNFNESPHKNKKAYSVTLQKDAGTNNYRSRMGINLFPLQNHIYTVIFEYYWPESLKIDLSSQASMAYINKQVQRDFHDYSKLLVQFNKNSNQGSNFLYLTLHGSCTATPVQLFIVIYGLKGWLDSADPTVYDSDYNDQMFEFKNGNMFMNTDIDMDNHRFKKNTTADQ